MKDIETAQDVESALNSLAAHAKKVGQIELGNHPAGILATMFLGNGNEETAALSNALVKNPALLSRGVWLGIELIRANADPAIAVNGLDLMEDLSKRMSDFNADKDGLRAAALALKQLLVEDFKKYKDPAVFHFLLNLARPYPDIATDVLDFAKAVMADRNYSDGVRQYAIYTAYWLAAGGERSAVDPAAVAEFIAPLVSNGESSGLRRSAATYEHNIVVSAFHRMDPARARKLRDVFTAQADAAQLWEFRKRGNNRALADLIDRRLHQADMEPNFRRSLTP